MMWADGHRPDRRPGSAVPGCPRVPVTHPPELETRRWYWCDRNCRRVAAGCGLTARHRVAGTAQHMRTTRRRHDHAVDRAPGMTLEPGHGVAKPPTFRPGLRPEG